MSAIEEEYPKALEKQFIPENRALWEVENYEEFLKERRKLIAENINSFLNTLAAKVEDEEPKEDLNWMDIINKGENNYVEFKSTLSYCLREKKPMKYIEKSIAKTIAAFLNSEGGQLFVGVDDNKNILGLDRDYKLSSKGDRDGFLLKFDNIIRDYLGNENIADIAHQFIKIDGKDVFVVEVRLSAQPVFLKDKGKKILCARFCFGLKETMDYTKKHWG